MHGCVVSNPGTKLSYWRRSLYGKGRWNQRGTQNKNCTNLKKKYRSVITTSMFYSLRKEQKEPKKTKKRRGKCVDIKANTKQGKLQKKSMNRGVVIATLACYTLLQEQEEQDHLGIE